MKELLTLTFGSCSNGIGAHFWNLQNELLSLSYGSEEDEAPEVNHAALLHGFASGRVHPRAVVYDVRDSVGLARAAAAARGQHGKDDQRNCARGSASWGDVLQPTLLSRSLVPVGGRSAAGDTFGSAAADGLSEAAAFDAFSLGRIAYADSLFEPVRAWLEECDGVQGVQAAADIDSGWGGVAESVLFALREELPRAALLVLGVAPPPTSLNISGNAAPGDFDFTGRSRSHVRCINLGVATAVFGGADNDLGAVFVPLCPSGDSIARAWRGNGSSQAERLAHAGAAVVAAAWDTATLPARRASGWNSDTLLVSSRVAGKTTRGSSYSAADPRTAPTRGRHVEGPDWGKVDVEQPPLPPRVALASDASFAQLLGAVSPSPDVRVASLAAAFPFPYSRARATEFDAVLRQAAPPHVGCWSADHRRVALLHTLSNWYCVGDGGEEGESEAEDEEGESKPHSRTAAGSASGVDRRAAETARRSDRPLQRSVTQHRGTSPTGGGRAWGASSNVAVVDTVEAPPYAHVVVVRGVGSHALTGASGDASATPGSGYASSVRAYACAVERWLERSGTPRAAHAVLRTPVAIPVSFARPRPSLCFDVVGAVAAVESGAQYDDSGGERGGDAEGVPLPYSMPAVVAMSSGPAMWPMLRRIAADFELRDGSVAHRFDEHSGGGTLSDVQAALFALADTYEPSNSNY